MKILFLDHSGVLGGAELFLLDIARQYRDSCLVALMAEGSFQARLEQEQIPVRVLSKQAIRVNRGSNAWQSFTSLKQIVPLVLEVLKLSRDYDVICTNTAKALVVGTIASFLSRRPLVHCLHDILTAEHFSLINFRLVPILTNWFAERVIANSKATQTAFVAAGGKTELTEVIYNGFLPERFQQSPENATQLRQQLRLEGRFVVGSFSRLSPWKGQHVLLEALTHCPNNVVALLVGDALFGEQEYVDRLHQQVAELGLHDRVKFLGFRADVSELMSACDLVAHTSTSPEPFGRVIVEAMLCQRPIVATAAGGVVELIEPGATGWLVPGNNAEKLAEVINECYADPDLAAAIAQRAYQHASQAFHLDGTCQKVAQVLERVVADQALTPIQTGTVL
ncbi:glycosyltransferase family 1 protein [Phormidesmis priestleyi ULC007]|uniref:Glycosyltransferase family 1 protein n=1 Tax=Phormidesmis priestleyi ULC007 TaxID=1920490 RepID=A0A2T1DNH2_9CYAN|nr:glycosyltransferase family 4 protein [Phormidesmis priestleyi]PSB22012.1 glycosyltransferase family 1 protein [Phormidesmis priestleyi ULC007]